ncbi:hypothetical protein [Streptomyces luteogriseus]|uniref:hypothetical protein n=1 Tax=Streptomyces luteogriseus TaxID=68233 RepID=UPI00378FCEA4
MNEVTELYHLGPEQCGNQTAYGLPGSRYCANYKAPGKEFCQECCEDIVLNNPGSDVRLRAWPQSMLTLFSPKGQIFVWPQRGQEGDEQHGHVFVFDNEEDWKAQMGHALRSLREDRDGDLGCFFADVVHVYESPFRELGGFHGLKYSLESLKEIAAVYGKPVPAQS